MKWLITLGVVGVGGIALWQLFKRQPVQPFQIPPSTWDPAAEWAQFPTGSSKPISSMMGDK